MNLTQSARDARARAYAPYSKYLVGAALADDRGALHTGCNVENISFGLTVCAERTAVVKMVSEGGRWVREIAVATIDGGTPCGMCLQVLAEFQEPGTDIRVTCVGENAERSFLLRELLPHGFTSDQV